MARFDSKRSRPSLDYHFGRKFRRQARELVPIELRPASSFEWKSNPYRVDAYVRPETEYTGLDYLVAYWLYRDLERR